jgi:hypothetical protein
MNREKLLSLLQKSYTGDLKADLGYIYYQYKTDCCNELIEEAIGDCTLEEYRACRNFFEFLMLGEKL